MKKKFTKMVNLMKVRYSAIIIMARDSKIIFLKHIMNFSKMEEYVEKMKKVILLDKKKIMNLTEKKKNLKLKILKYSKLDSNN